MITPRNAKRPTAASDNAGAQYAFEIDQNLLYHTVMRQAQGVPKAILELTQNSLDARATRVSLHLDETSFVVEDDGHGFGTDLEAIHRVFGRFGTPHVEGDARFGRFRIGRAQILAYASVEWRSGTVALRVDFLRNGLRYDVAELAESQPGCRVSGTFYHDPYRADAGDAGHSIGERLMTPNKVQATLLEVAAGAQYADVPIVVNGQQINTPPDAVAWDLVTPEAYYKWTRSGGVKVYNMGFLVKTFPSYELGNGIVVTKASLDLTLSRQDILAERDATWRAIRAELRRRLDTDAGKPKASKRLEPHEQMYHVRRFLQGEADLADLESLAALTDIYGAPCSLKTLLAHQSHLVAVAEQGDQTAQTLHHNKAAFVLASVTLERFAVARLDDLLKLWRERAQSERVWRLFEKLRALQVGDLAALAATYNTRLLVLKDAELTPAERLGLNVLRDRMSVLARVIAANLGIEAPMLPPRRLIAGDAAADGWTDGRSTIVINRRLLPQLARGYAGALEAVAVLVHEYCHDEPTAEQHIDNEAFYERFHNAWTPRDDVRSRVGIGAVIEQVVAAYIAQLRALGKRYGRAGTAANNRYLLDALLQDLTAASPEGEAAFLHGAIDDGADDGADLVAGA